MDTSDLAAIDFDKGGGLVPVIAQHYLTGEVLMLAYATREAVRISLDTGRLTFYSRSRNALWTKGETSGHTLRVVSIHGDCDGDTVLARVDPAGPTCHTGARGCFQAEASVAMGPSEAPDSEGPPAPSAAPTLRGLADVLESRRDSDPETSYTARLLADRNLRLKKLGEEALELAVACADEDVERVREEAADVVYHTLVAAMAVGVGIEDVLETLESRR